MERVDPNRSDYLVVRVVCHPLVTPLAVLPTKGYRPRLPLRTTSPKGLQLYSLGPQHLVSGHPRRSTDAHTDPQARPPVSLFTLRLTTLGRGRSDGPEKENRRHCGRPAGYDWNKDTEEPHEGDPTGVEGPVGTFVGLGDGDGSVGGPRPSEKRGLVRDTWD